MNIQSCVVDMKYLFMMMAIVAIGAIFYNTKKLYLYQLLLSFFFLNIIIAFYLHSVGVKECFIIDKFFYLLVVLWMLEVPFIVGLYIYKLFKKRHSWSVFEQRKFVIAIGIWIIEFSMLVKFL
jgi:hypothetical protein